MVLQGKRDIRSRKRDDELPAQNRPKRLRCEGRRRRNRPVPDSAYAAYLFQCQGEEFYAVSCDKGGANIPRTRLVTPTGVPARRARPGAPHHLRRSWIDQLTTIVAAGAPGHAYLVDRNNLGGISENSVPEMPRKRRRRDFNQRSRFASVCTAPAIHCGAARPRGCMASTPAACLAQAERVGPI
jgi:hypothetical protein